MYLRKNVLPDVRNNATAFLRITIKENPQGAIALVNGSDIAALPMAFGILHETVLVIR